MVDAEDLKSFGHCDRVGSSPTIPTTLRQGYGWQATKNSYKAMMADYKISLSRAIVPDLRN